MANKKITDLTADTTVQPNDLTVTVDVGASESKKATWSNVVAGLNGLVATLTGSTFTGPITAAGDGGITGSITRTTAGTPYITVPSGNIITVTTGSNGQIILSGSGTTPTGTGFVHVTAGAQDAAAKLVVDSDVDAAAAIAVTKLATGAAGTVLKGGASNAFGAVVNADVDAAAAIAGTKIAPDFGAQDVKTTGKVYVGGKTIEVDGGGQMRFGITVAPAGYVYHDGGNFGWYSGGAYRFYADTSSFQFATPRIGLSAPYASDGQANVALSGVAYTLTAAEYSRAFIAFTGTAGVTVTFPSVADNDHAYAKDIINTCGAAVTLSNGGATTASIAGGDTKGRYWFNASGVFGPF